MCFNIGVVWFGYLKLASSLGLILYSSVLRTRRDMEESSSYFTWSSDRVSGGSWSTRTGKRFFQMKSSPFFDY